MVSVVILSTVKDLTLVKNQLFKQRLMTMNSL